MTDPGPAWHYAGAVSAFVGRRVELDTLLGLVRLARRDRRPTSALISGVPGSGKTRLLAEVLRAVQDQRVARIHGFEPMQSIPLAASADLLRLLIRPAGPGADLERLVFGDTDGRARDPLRIFEAAFRAVQVDGPLVIAVDDVQWLDDQSLALLQYLTRAAAASGTPLAVLAAGRPSPVTANLADAFAREVEPDRHHLASLAPLAEAEGRELVQSIDIDLSDALATDLWRRARGSPFWLEALARDGSTGARSKVVEERVSQLGEDAASLLSALAIGARPFGTDEIARIVGWDPERVRLAARELTARGLTVQDGAFLRVAHDLIREWLTAELPAATRQRLHSLLADGVEAESGNDVALLCEALVHRREAGQDAGALALRILESPRRRLLTASNLRLLTAIADELPDPALRVALDVGIADVAAKLGEPALALERWAGVSEHAADGATRQHAAVEAASAAYAVDDAEAAHRHLDAARQIMPPPPDTGVRIDALRSETHLWLDHETAAGAALAAKARADAERMVESAGGLQNLEIGARRAWVVALEAAADAALQEDRGADVVAISEDLLFGARDVDEEAYLGALLRTAFALRPLGRIQESVDRYGEAWDLSRRLVLPIATVDAGHGLARGLRDLGRAREGREIALETAALERRLGTAPRRWGNATAILHHLELSLGKPGALEALRADADAERDRHFRIGIHQTIAAWHARVAGAREAAKVEAELDEARACSDDARCPRCRMELAITSAELYARIGRVDIARQELAGFDAATTPGYLQRDLWRMRADAAISRAADEPARAIAILRDLATLLGQVGLREDLTWAHIDLGRTLTTSNRDDAVAAFVGAADLAEEAGLLTAARVARRHLRDLGVRAWRRGRAGAGGGLAQLTMREQEVARLVAEGLSNREIAETLMVSPKTVERHVTNVLAKLDLRNRVELASAALAESQRADSPVRGSPDDLGVIAP